ncbi:hypothetical protein AA0472_2611 [Acetobacter estunensis NRIC 0472]|nr:hypothetical protein AA0472_2611 [Acetobacter estunensis NRIC 0472]
MTDIQASDKEIWLLDVYGRFLHNDPVSDRLETLLPEDLPPEGPGVLLHIDSQKKEEPFRLVKRDSRPVPLPHIVPHLGGDLTVRLEVTDRQGPFAASYGHFLTGTDDGGVDAVEASDTEAAFVPVPARTARVLLPSSPLKVRDEWDTVLLPPRADEGMCVRVGAGAYPWPVVSELLTRMANMSPGEILRQHLPEIGDIPALRVEVSCPTH